MFKIGSSFRAFYGLQNFYIDLNATLSTGGQSRCHLTELQLAVCTPSPPTDAASERTPFVRAPAGMHSGFLTQGPIVGPLHCFFLV